MYIAFFSLFLKKQIIAIIINTLFVMLLWKLKKKSIMADVKKLAPFIQRWEGGFVDDPDDLGGATNMGVTIATYKVYRKRKGLSEPTVDDLKHLSNNEWIDILKSLYWDKWKSRSDKKSICCQYFGRLGMGFRKLWCQDTTKTAWSYSRRYCGKKYPCRCQ